MANRSYLCATGERTLDFKNGAVLANDVWCVPLLWLALFRAKNLVEEDLKNDDGESFHSVAPIASLPEARRQLEEAVPYLNRVFKREGPVDEHAGMLELLADVKRKFLALHLLEIAALDDPEAYYRKVRSALECLEAGDASAAARKNLEELAQLRPTRKFPPARAYLDDLPLTDDDHWNHARLLGASYENDVPWETRTAVPEDPPLMSAVDEGNVSTVKTLLRAGADPNQKNWLDTCAIDNAVKHGPALVRLLLKAGARPTDFAVILACRFGQADVLRLLLAHGGNARAEDGTGRDCALACAFYARDAKAIPGIVQQLLKAGAEVNPPAGRSPLASAVSKDAIPLAKLLLKRGADVNARTKDGWTVLSSALNGLAKNLLARVALLLEAGADPNKAGVWVPVILAVDRTTPAVVNLLLENGARPNRRGKDGKTALLVAIGKPRTGFALARLLLEHGADPNQSGRTADVCQRTRGGFTVTIDQRDWSPLTLAAARGDADIAALLLEAGASINAKDGQGQTPLGHAVAENHRDVAALLRQHGAK